MKAKRIINDNVLTNHGNLKGRKDIVDIMETGLEAADPYYNALKLVKRDGNMLTIGHDEFVPEGSPHPQPDVYDLTKDIDRIFVFGAGKGIQRVVKALEEVLGDYLTGGHVVTKHGDEIILNKVGVTLGGHPVPDEDCVKGCREIVRKIKEAKLTERDLVFTVVGNGVSSLLTLPAEGLELKDVMDVTSIMQIQKGLYTKWVNFVRNQIDQLKGGRITRLLAPAKMVHIMAIDVNEKGCAGENENGEMGYLNLMHNNIWLHTLPDRSSAQAAIDILKRNDIWMEVSEGIRNYLEHSTPETDVMKQEEFEKLDCRIFGIMPTHMNFLPVAMQRCSELGYTPHLMMRKTRVEASACGALLGRIANCIESDSAPFEAPCALVLTGEMLVTVGDQTGIGGRNQECALSAATVIRGSKRIVMATADTDGTDGPGGRFSEDAWAKGCRNLTGGVVDGYTVLEAEAKGVDVPMALKRHATSACLWDLDSGIWATQNISVQDLIVVLVTGEDC